MFVKVCLFSKIKIQLNILIDKMRLLIISILYIIQLTIIITPTTIEPQEIVLFNFLVLNSPDRYGTELSYNFGSFNDFPIYHSFQLILLFCPF